MPDGPTEDASTSWEEPFPAAVLPLETDRDWAHLRELYTRGPNDTPLDRCLTVARENKAHRVVIETRYVDPDYRSEYTAFYARAFANFPDSAHRVHFFSSRDIELRNLSNLPEDHGYLGYVVIRPLRVPAAVGRAMLRPPPTLEHGVRTAAEEIVTFFGQPLSVVAVPFMQQDGQFGRCAHTASWVCHYSAFLRQEVARRPVAYFSATSNPNLGTGRTLPVEGLTVPEIRDLLRLLELHVKHYSVRALVDSDRPEDWKPKVRPSAEARIARIARRYMDSGMPFIVVAQEVSSRQPVQEKHAFVVCGYFRDGASSMHLVVNDDQRGPYIEVDSVQAGRTKIGSDEFNWEHLIVPLPEKLWMTGETAERFGCSMLRAAAKRLVQTVPSAQVVIDRHDAGRLRVCTYATRNNAFKLGVRDRFTSDPVIFDAYNLARLSRYVWVVELIDHDIRSGGGEEYVLAEMVFDPTSGNIDPLPLATRLPGAISIRVDNTRTVTVPTSVGTFRSGGIKQ